MTNEQFAARFAALRLTAQAQGEYLIFKERGEMVATVSLFGSLLKIEVVSPFVARPFKAQMRASSSVSSVVATLKSLLIRAWQAEPAELGPCGKCTECRCNNRPNS